MKMSSSGCSCGSSCKCGDNCQCGVYGDVEKSSTVPMIQGLVPVKMYWEASEESSGAESGHGCKCGSNCTCNPCNC